MLQNIPEISIVVPVYNVEKYLPECLRSIRDQTFENWEAILVNDASTDNSLAICNSFAENDGRFRVFSMPRNCGLAGVRSFGIEKATGKYIGFIDSDDVAMPEMVETLLSLIKEYEADIAFGEIERFHDMKEINRAERADGEKRNADGHDRVELWDRDGFARVFFKIDGNKTVCYMHCRLFRKEVAEAIDIPRDISHGEDVIATCQTLLKSCRIVHTDRKMYYYRYNPESITGGKFSAKDLQLIRVWDYVKELTGSANGIYYEYADLNRKRIAMTLLYRMHTDHMQGSFKSEEDSLRRELLENASNLLKSPMPFSRKMILFGYSKCFCGMRAVLVLFGKVRRFWKKVKSA